jgi:hypothetical protein
MDPAYPQHAFARFAQNVGPALKKMRGLVADAH